ncbi:MAG: CRTAC1 family protein [Verrucomicrobia bacterium]|nr:CRTAC1 family protein [Verrucomicrobiota bacterium]
MDRSSLGKGKWAVLLALLFNWCVVQPEMLQSAVLFKDQAAALGLTLGTDAACWVDIDNDGWVDLCASGVVWKNNAGKGFTKFAEAGLVVAADFDNDGYVDLFSRSQMKLYHNNSGKGFSEFPLPELPRTVSLGACWGDLNGDGFVDLYIGGYEDWDAGITYPSMVLINDHGKSFKLLSTDKRYRARGVTACDFNRDSHLDVYVSNYRLQPNLLLLNDGSGRLKDVAAEYNAVATSPGFEGGHSIGACWADFDNDGEFDLFAGNFAHVDSRGDQPKSRFLRNLGGKQGYHFKDLGTCGVFYQESYASPAAGDYDNDGKVDLFFTTVYATASFNKQNHPVLYHNDGDFVFTDATATAGVSELGPTYQAAWADFNHDGNLDLATCGKLFVNQGSSGKWVAVHLAGDGQAVNRSAIGAQVRIKLKDKILTRQVEAGTGEGNQNDLTLHFGLGAWEGSVNLEILWPNGITQTIKDAGTNHLIEVRFDAQQR